jgi:hypothetical protein
MTGDVAMLRTLAATVGTVLPVVGIGVGNSALESLLPDEERADGKFAVFSSVEGVESAAV